jgi:hypothetical protein
VNAGTSAAARAAGCSARPSGWLAGAPSAPFVLLTPIKQAVNGVAPYSLAGLHQLHLLASVASFH